jgi:hypothetical protein
MRELQHGSVEVTDTASMILEVPQNVSSVKMYNAGEDVVFIGGVNVCDTGEFMGIPLKPGEKADFSLYDSDSIGVYAVTAKDVVSQVVYLIS